MSIYERFKETIRQYYEEEIYKVLNTKNRTFQTGVILLLIKFYLHLSLIISPQMVDQFNTTDSNLSQVLKSVFIRSGSHSLGVFYLGVVLTGLFWIALLNDFLFCEYKLFQASARLSRRYLVRLSQIYSFVLYLPFLYFSIDQMHENNLIAVYGIIATILIGIFIYLPLKLIIDFKHSYQITVQLFLNQK